MRRCSNCVLWLGICVVLAMPGCSDSPLPPLAAIQELDAERPKASGAPATVVSTGTIEPQTIEPDNASRASAETADAALRAIMRGLQQGHPDVLWDALPASYQQDLNDLVRLSASRLNPAAWRWFLQIVGKSAKIVRLLKESVTSEGSSSEEMGKSDRQARAFETLATLLERISNSGPWLLERMKTGDLGDILRTEGRPLVSILSPLVDLVDEKLSHSLRELLHVSVTAEDSATDCTVLKIGGPQSHGARVEFVRVEEKWIPKWLAERWAGAMVSAKQSVCAALPSDTASDNFGRTFQGLAAVEFSVDAWLWQIEHPGVDPDSMFSEIPSVTNALILLGYLIGGPPTVEPDFHTKTKESLSGNDTVTLVYCYAPKELRSDHESLNFDLAKHVAYQLNAEKITVVDPDRVYAWLDKHDRWRKTAEIGAAFKVDYIVHIDVKDYSLTEANANNLYRGRADCIVNVVKMDENKRDGTVIYTTPIKSVFPKNGPVDASAMPDAEFKKRYLSALSYEIGKLFSAETGDEIPYDMLQQ